MAAWVADNGGPDRKRLYTDLLKEEYGRVWITLAARTPIPQLWALLMDRPAPAGQPQNADDLKDWIRARQKVEREKQGLPDTEFVS